MARRSLDGLIGFLLDSTALKGEYGVCPSEFIDLVNAYYLEDRKDRSIQEAEEPFPPALETPRPNIDRPFLELVWRWLVAHPEIRVGEHNQYVKLSLAEAESLVATSQQQAISGPVTREAGSVNVEDAVLIDPALTNTLNHEASAQSLPTTQTSEYLTQTDTIADEPKSDPSVRLYASESRMWYALTGHDVDLTRVKNLELTLLSIIGSCGSKGILQNDLVKISGQDKRSLPQRTDRLHATHYIEKKPATVRVGEITSSESHIVYTSRCTLTRFVKGTESPENNPSPDDIDKGFDSLDPKTQAKRRKNIKKRRGRRILAECDKEARPNVVPQWVSDRSVSNQIHDVVDRAGTDGATLSEIRDRLFGKDYQKPMEGYLAKLVDYWQVSQPLHLRHLAIIRDTVLRQKSPIYIHYTHDSFQKLVERGKTTWAAVTTVEERSKDGKATAASLDAKPELDEYGFPMLDIGLFYGQRADATPIECAKAFGSVPARIVHGDPIVTYKADGSSNMEGSQAKKHAPRASAHSRVTSATFRPQAGRAKRRRSSAADDTLLLVRETGPSNKRNRHNLGEANQIPPSDRADLDGTEPQPPAHKDSVHNSAPLEKPAPEMKSIAVTKGVGRPRKWAKNAASVDIKSLTKKELRQMRGSLIMAEKYQKEKMVAEIKSRIDEGVDSSIVANEVLRETNSMLQDADEEPISEYLSAQILHDFAGGPAPPHRDEAGAVAKLPKVDSRQTGKFRQWRPKAKKPSPEKHEYWPSIAAHTCRIPDTQALRIMPGKKTPQRKKASAPTQPKIDKRSVMLYYPSVIAHSRPNVRPTIQRQHGKRARDDDSIFRYLPSIAAHSGPFLPVEIHTTKTPASKRPKTSLAVPRNGNDAVTFASISEAATPPPPTRKPPFRDPEYQKAMAKRYATQSKTMKRESDGIYIGKTRQFKRAGEELAPLPGLMYKLVIFKFSRLNDLAWFTADSPFIHPPVTSTALPKPSTSLRDRSLPLDSQRVQMSFAHENSKNSDEHLPSFQATAQLDGFHNASPALPNLQTGSKKRKRSVDSLSQPRPPPNKGFTQFPSNTSLDSDLQVTGISYSMDVSANAALAKGSGSSISTISRDHQGIPELNRQSMEFDDRAQSRDQESPSVAGGSVDIFAAAASRNVHQPTQRPNKDLESMVSTETTIQETEEPRANAHNNQHSIAPQISQNPPQPIFKSKDSYRRKGLGTLSRFGGSIAMIRKEIIMELVRRCEGVAPGYQELSLPFITEWHLREQPGVPEKSTVRTAVSALCTAHKLKQITFALRSRQGQVATKSILLLPEISINDPRIRPMQQEMEALYPRLYIPKILLPPDGSPSYNFTSGRVPREHNGSEGSLFEFQRRLEGHKTLIEAKERAEQQRLRISSAEDGALSRPLSPVRLDVLPVYKSRRGAKQTKDGKAPVKRLASIRKPKIIGPPRSRKVQPPSRRLEWVEHDFQEANAEEDQQDVPLVIPRPDEVSYSASLDEPPRQDDSLKAGVQDYEAVPRPAEANHVTGTETDQWKHQRLSAFPPNFDRGRFPAQRRRVGEWRHEEKPVNRRPSLSQKSSLPAVWYKKSTMASFMNPSHVFHDTTGTFSASFSGLLPARSTSTVVSRRPRPSLSYAARLIPSYMHPEQRFDPRNGTFSTEFTGLKLSTVELTDSSLIAPALMAKAKAPKAKKRITASLPEPTSLTWSIQHYDPAKPIEFQFDFNVDQVLKRELSIPGVENIRVPGWPFINHFLAHPQKEAFDDDSVEDENGDRPVPGRRGSLNWSDFGIDEPVDPGQDADGNPTRKHRIRRRAAAGLKRRRLTTLTENEKLKEPALEKTSKGPLIRSSRTLTYLSEAEEKRLLTAVTVVRSITGGLDKRIDWVLVASVFQPQRDPNFIRSRWSYVLQRYRAVVEKMESTFQDLFAGAYEEGLLPPINYDDLANYDWKWLVEWAMTRLDDPLHSVSKLPARRRELDNNYALEEQTNDDISQFYELDQIVNTHYREAIINHHTYTYPMGQKVLSPPGVYVVDQAQIAKTWVRALIVTPEEVYNADAARDILSIFPEPTLNAATAALVNDRVITQENKGRPIPGRGYDVSQHFLRCFQKNLLPIHFEKAAAQKKQLDRDFAETGTATFDPSAEDGDMVAILNLLANRRITLAPDPPPLNKWGHTEKYSYETRQMDKTRMYFPVTIRPLSNYACGNPIAPFPAPPAHHLHPYPTNSSPNPDEDTKQKPIPVWYDIFGSLIPPIWSLVLAATLTVLSMRPGIGAREIEQNLRPGMEEWEIQWVLDWMVEARLARVVGGIGKGGWKGRAERGKRYMADEWWWLAFSGGEGDGVVADGCGDDGGRGMGRGSEGQGLDVMNAD